MELSNFREKNWNEWLNNFDRYNLSPSIWYRVRPQRWRFEVSQYWKGRNQNLINEINEKNLARELLVPVTNPPSEQVEKRNKLLRNIILAYSYFDSKKDSLIKKFSGTGSAFSCTTITMDDTHRSNSIHNEQIPCFITNGGNKLLSYNLISWLIPEFVRGRNVYRWEKILDLEAFAMKNANQNMLRNKELFRKRELNQSVRQWKWKSNRSERRFKELGNMASLMTFMQDQETMISLSEKMREDLNSFRLLFRANISPNQLTIDSEHRLLRLLDDQILMYKMMSTLLNFKQRLEKVSNSESANKYYYYWNEVIINNGEKMNSLLLNSLNLEDVLLPKRRRELRILNCLSLNEKGYGNLIEGIDISRGKIDRSGKIRRFIWSSYRFEDLACMNRFWFDTINGSRFSLLKFRMYPSI